VRRGNLSADWVEGSERIGSRSNVIHASRGEGGTLVGDHPALALQLAFKNLVNKLLKLNLGEVDAYSAQTSRNRGAHVVAPREMVLVLLVLLTISLQFQNPSWQGVLYAGARSGPPGGIFSG
jgi:hypothetical protein